MNADSFPFDRSVASEAATGAATYCSKLAGPCPDGCAGVKVACSDRLHGDCWRVKQPSTCDVALPVLTDEQIERIAQATFRRVQDMPDDKVNGSTWDREFARAVLAAAGAKTSKGEQNGNR